MKAAGAEVIRCPMITTRLLAREDAAECVPRVFWVPAALRPEATSFHVGANLRLRKAVMEIRVRLWLSWREKVSWRLRGVIQRADVDQEAARCTAVSVESLVVAGGFGPIIQDNSATREPLRGTPRRSGAFSPLLACSHELLH